MGGHASSRVYHRLSKPPSCVDSRSDSNTATPFPSSVVIMQMMSDVSKSDEAVSVKSQKDLAQRSLNESPFVRVQRFLREGAIPVPEIFSVLSDEGLIVLEDLGDVRFEDVVSRASKTDRIAWYQAAIDLLISMQAHAALHLDDIRSSLSGFDKSLLKWELDHFYEWFLLEERRLTFSTQTKSQLESLFVRIVDELCRLPYNWVHRDFQSRNLMVSSIEEKSLTVIDFQDALLGPVCYDLVALLCDSYIELPLNDVTQLINYYYDAASRRNLSLIQSLDRNQYHRAFWLQAAQRKMKDTGRFIFIDRVKHNPSFLIHVPLSLQYVARALSAIDELAPLQRLLADYVPELRLQ